MSDGQVPFPDLLLKVFRASVDKVLDLWQLPENPGHGDLGCLKALGATAISNEERGCLSFADRRKALRNTLLSSSALKRF